MYRCTFCKLDLPSDGDYIRCDGCSKVIHFQCAGVSQTTWKAKSEAKKNEWRCVRCREAVNAKTSRNKSSSDDDLSKLHRRRDDPGQPMGIDNDTMMKNIQKMMQEQFDIQTKKLNAKLADYEKSVCFNSQQVDEFLAVMKEIKEEFKQIKSTQAKLDVENKELRKELSSLRQEVEDLQQQGRNKNLQIHGLVEGKDEDLKGILRRVSDVLEIPKQDVGIEEAYRLPSMNKDLPRPIVVEFSSRRGRNNFLDKAKRRRLNVKDVYPNAEPKPIYVNEQLTPFYKKVLYEAKKYQKSKNYKYLWTKDGRILMKKDDNQQTRRISNLGDLERL